MGGGIGEGKGGWHVTLLSRYHSNFNRVFVGVVCGQSTALVVTTAATLNQPGSGVNRSLCWVHVLDTFIVTCSLFLGCFDKLWGRSEVNLTLSVMKTCL